jgi:transposase
MLSIGQDTQIYIRRVATDMRNSFDGLSALACDLIRRNPTVNQFFVFLNKRRNIVKILSWDSDGLALYAKRLEQGTYRPPDISPDGTKTIDRAELMLMLDGIDVIKMKRRKRYGK